MYRIVGTYHGHVHQQRYRTSRDVAAGKELAPLDRTQYLRSGLRAAFGQLHQGFRQAHGADAITLLTIDKVNHVLYGDLAFYGQRGVGGIGIGIRQRSVVEQRQRSIHQSRDVESGDTLLIRFAQSRQVVDTPLGVQRPIFDPALA